MGKIEVKRQLLEEALYQLKGAQQDYYVISTQNIIDELEVVLRQPDVSISLPDYEYEMLIDDEGTPFEINSWILIATDRIKDLSRIDEYIDKGLIRKTLKHQ